MNNEYLVSDGNKIIVGTDKGMAGISDSVDIKECEIFLIIDNTIETLEKENNQILSDIRYMQNLRRYYKKQVIQCALISIGGVWALYAVFSNNHDNYIIDFKSPLIPAGFFGVVTTAVLLPVVKNYILQGKLISAARIVFKKNEILLQTQKHMKQEKEMLLSTPPELVNLTDKTKEYLLNLRKEAEELYNSLSCNNQVSIKGKGRVKTLREK